MRVPTALEILRTSEIVEYSTFYPYDDRRDIRLEFDVLGVYIPALDISIRRGKEIKGNCITNINVIFDNTSTTEFLYYYSGDYLESIKDCLESCSDENNIRVEDIKKLDAKFILV